MRRAAYCSALLALAFVSVCGAATDMAMDTKPTFARRTTSAAEISSTGLFADGNAKAPAEADGGGAGSRRYKP
jgi:hypothetical protein